MCNMCLLLFCIFVIRPNDSLPLLAEICSLIYTECNVVLRRMRWAGHVARMVEERGVYRVLVWETGGKETTGET